MPTDIWASGILFYAMLCGRFPFKGKDTKDLYKSIASGQFSFPDNVRISTEVKQLIMRMLVINPLNRANATQLLNDPCLKAITIRKENSMGSDFLST